jgi:periplasmic protein TonB
MRPTLEPSTLVEVRLSKALRKGNPRLGLSLNGHIRCPGQREHDMTDTASTSQMTAAQAGHPVKRFGAVILPAAIATAALFVMMDRVIGVDEVQFGERPRITLPDIRPAAPDPQAPRSTREPIERTETLKPPPRPARRLDSGEPGRIAPAVYEVTPSIEIRPEPVSLTPMAPVMPDREIQPIRPPVPVYPRAALERGLEGRCEVRFDVDPRGKPYNVTADCTDSVFTRSAEAAMRKVEFAPELRNGQPMARRNVVYPLDYVLAE